MYWSYFRITAKLIVESGAHPFLHSNCQDQLIYIKFNLQIYYPPQYFWGVWHYRYANTELTRRVFDQFSWEQNFLNKNFNEKVEIFDKTILNTHSNSNIIMHEAVIINDRDPWWFNSEIKSLLNAKLLNFMVVLEIILVSEGN